MARCSLRRCHQRPVGWLTSIALAIALCIGLVAVNNGRAEEGKAALPAAVDRKVDFVKDVQPIFVRACYRCHGPEDQSSDYRLDQKKIALTGGSLGGAIVPGNSEKSLLIRYVAGLEEGMEMPADGDPLPAEEVGILRAWIDQGADWPDAASAADDKSDHWAYQPLVDTAPPATRRSDWIKTPIDAFVLARLEQQGLAPARPADKRTLIRRLTFDLHGLAPTPEQIAQFLADDAPDAYERLIDRLLASPHYGERWARHWMDVVHFAETHGNDQDRPRPHAWPYRDYLIRSFNEDKPYARFIQEQLAGDVLFPGDPEALVATGFMAAGPWDESSQMCIVDDTVDKKIAQTLDRDDMVTTTMSTFVSSTVHCARCHNHKFDPISQADYYSLQAVFAGVDRVDRAYDADPQVAQRRQSLLDQKLALENGTAPVAQLLAPAMQAEVAAWEKGIAEQGGLWAVLEPLEVVSSGGSTPVKQSDHSILFTGTRPEKDTYTITVRTDLKGITAVRIEVLTDESLPHQGPGRQDNGNLHLSEFQLQAAPEADPAAAQPVGLHNPSADFDQQGWTAAMAIDGKLETAWGIYPEVGKPHHAVFEVKESLGFDGGTLLTFVLQQQHGGGHLIGRPRVAITTANPPVSAASVPAEVAAVLAVPAAERNSEQQATLARYVARLRIERQLAELPAMQMVYTVASDFMPRNNLKPARMPRPIHILRRGDINQPLEPADPGALSCLSRLEPRFPLANPNDEGSRRVALARWISDPQNVLTWRSIVNRVWHYHFGRGLVDTPNDFGHMGSQPTHPELLDWLALRFLESGGSLKQLHRLILMSAVYRQSSEHHPDYAAIDAGNHYLWRMNRTRLDAESVRDAVLQVSGKIDWTMGGPSVKQFIESPGIHVTPNVDYNSFDVDSPGSYRRSVYRFLFRTLPDPFMESMDCPDASQLAPTRTASVTALQALAMLNNRFLVRQCEHAAARLSHLSSEPAGQIAALYQLALGRDPTPEETAALVAYGAKHGMANVCRLILNSNEFMFVN